MHAAHQADQLRWLLALLIVPGLLGLLALMQWLESHLTIVSLADDLAGLLRTDINADDLEAEVARRAQMLFRDKC